MGRLNHFRLNHFYRLILWWSRRGGRGRLGMAMWSCRARSRGGCVRVLSHLLVVMFGLRRGVRMLRGLAFDGGLVVRRRRGRALRRRSRRILCRRCGGGLVLCDRDHGNRREQENRSQNNRQYLYRFHFSP